MSTFTKDGIKDKLYSRLALAMEELKIAIALKTCDEGAIKNQEIRNQDAKILKAKRASDRAVKMKAQKVPVKKEKYEHPGELPPHEQTTKDYKKRLNAFKKAHFGKNKPLKKEGYETGKDHRPVYHATQNGAYDAYSAQQNEGEEIESTDPHADLKKQYKAASPEQRKKMDKNIAMNTDLTGKSHADAVYKARMKQLRGEDVDEAAIPIHPPGTKVKVNDPKHWAHGKVGHVTDRAKTGMGYHEVHIPGEHPITMRGDKLSPNVNKDPLTIKKESVNESKANKVIVSGTPEMKKHAEAINHHTAAALKHRRNGDYAKDPEKKAFHRKMAAQHSQSAKEHRSKWAAASNRETPDNANKDYHDRAHATHSKQLQPSHVDISKDIAPHVKSVKESTMKNSISKKQMRAITKISHKGDIGYQITDHTGKVLKTHNYPTKEPVKEDYTPLVPGERVKIANTHPNRKWRGKGGTFHSTVSVLNGHHKVDIDGETGKHMEIIHHRHLVRESVGDAGPLKTGQRVAFTHPNNKKKYSTGHVVDKDGEHHLIKTDDGSNKHYHIHRSNMAPINEPSPIKQRGTMKEDHTPQTVAKKNPENIAPRKPGSKKNFKGILHNLKKEATQESYHPVTRGVDSTHVKDGRIYPTKKFTSSNLANNYMHDNPKYKTLHHNTTTDVHHLVHKDEKGKAISEAYPSDDHMANVALAMMHGTDAAKGGVSHDHKGDAKYHHAAAKKAASKGYHDAATEHRKLAAYHTAQAAKKNEGWEQDRYLDENDSFKNERNHLRKQIANMKANGPVKGREQDHQVRMDAATKRLHKIGGSDPHYRKVDGVKEAKTEMDDLHGLLEPIPHHILKVGQKVHVPAPKGAKHDVEGGHIHHIEKSGLFKKKITSVHVKRDNGSITKHHPNDIGMVHPHDESVNEYADDNLDDKRFMTPDDRSSNREGIDDNYLGRNRQDEASYKGSNVRVKVNKPGSLNHGKKGTVTKGFGDERHVQLDHDKAGVVTKFNLKHLHHIHEEK